MGDLSAIWHHGKPGSIAILSAVSSKAQGVSILIRLTILGEPASKANSRREAVNPRTGQRSIIKSKKALNYRDAALQQIPPHARQQLAGAIRIDIRIYYASRRPDLDESLILDILQDQYTNIAGMRVICQRGVYINDRQVKEKHIYHRIDKRNPRVELQITEIAS